MQIPMLIPMANNKSIELIEMTTIHSDVIPKRFSSIGAGRKKGRKEGRGLEVKWDFRKKKKEHIRTQSATEPSQSFPISSSEPSSQWLTLSHSKSGLIQNSFDVQRKSLHVCSAKKGKESKISFMHAKSTRFICYPISLLPSLIAVITSLKLLSLPHESVTYLNVM